MRFFLQKYTLLLVAPKIRLVLPQIYQKIGETKPQRFFKRVHVYDRAKNAPRCTHAPSESSRSTSPLYLTRMIIFLQDWENEINRDEETNDLEQNLKTDG